MSSVINITVLMVLDGEPGWVCMMCCNSDSRCRPEYESSLCAYRILVLFSVLVLHWVTSVDRTRVQTQYTYNPGSRRKTFDKPYDGTNGTYSTKQQSKADCLTSQQDEDEKQKALVTTHIEANVDVQRPQNTPIDRIAVITERMTRVEFESDIIDEISPASTKVDKRFVHSQSESSGNIDEIVETEKV
jgi:hypothetical protein